VLNELRFSLSALPETAISMIQGFVSLRRIQKYLSQAEVTPGSQNDDDIVALRSATITWPRDVAYGTSTGLPSTAPSATNTPKSSAFTLADLTIDFPKGKLSLISGPLGSGKSLLLLGLLGEADVLAGQVICPRSSAMAFDDYGVATGTTSWILPGKVAFSSQIPFLLNASIRDNIIFGAPEDKTRLRQVVQMCALQSDLDQLEDGEWTEIGEKGQLRGRSAPAVL
jgi:ABC-type multidrug transport system fused ATPase/permease subunit